MNRNFERALSLILKHEGGYVNHPSDPGGATNKGITIATYRRYIKRNGTVADLKRLTTAQAGVVYKKRYWDRVRGDDLPDGVDYAVADFAVNSGPRRGALYLQKVVGAKQDGKIGPATMAAVRKMPSVLIIHRLCDERLSYMKRLKRGKLWKTFGRGWSRRVAGVRKHAIEMTRQSKLPPDIITPKPPQKPVQPRQPDPAPTQQKPSKPAPVNRSGGFLASILKILSAWSKS